MTFLTADSFLGPYMSCFDDPEICRSILENLPSGLCVVDLQKKIVFWSTGAERITGHLRHDVVGHCCVGEALLHCDQPGCEFCHEECPLARSMKTSQPAEAVGLLHHKAGHEIPIRVRAVPVRNARGSIIGALETFEDQQAVNLDHRDDRPAVPGSVDDVSGVASHAIMRSHLRETLGTFNDVQVPFGILCFRLEGLEHFRSSFGPEAASSLLRVVARTLEGALWKTDFVGRWADDQFLVILNGCSEEALRSVRERFRRMLANDSIGWWGERRTLAVSIGQATPQAGDTIDLLIQRAHQALDSASLDRARAAGATARPSPGS